MTLQLDMFETSQADRVLRMLRENELGICGTDFLKVRIPRYSARLKELRNAGHVIENRKCHSHHHQTKQVRYILIPPREHTMSLSE